MALPVSPFVGHSDIEVAHQGEFTLRKEIDVAADFVSNVYTLALPPELEVLEVRLRTKVAGTGGSTPTTAVAVGGTSMIAAADYDPSQAAGYMKTSLLAAEAGSNGVYTGANGALLTVTQGGATPISAGKFVLSVRLAGGESKPKDMINNW